MNAAPAAIKSLPELRKFIKEADLILGMLRFGVVEKWIKISKKEALYQIEGLSDDDTPERLSMYSGDFGTIEIDDNTGEMLLYIG